MDSKRFFTKVGSIGWLARDFLTKGDLSKSVWIKVGENLTESNVGERNRGRKG